MKYTRECLLDELRTYWDANNKVPNSRAFHIHQNVYRNIFGNWNNALREAGIPTRAELKKEMLDVICEHCNQHFTRKYSQQQYCSRSCAASVSNTNRVKRHSRPIAYCLQCEMVLRPTNKKFCSSKCSGDYRVQQTIRKWLNGEISGNIDSAAVLSKTIRDYLLKQANYKCSVCEWGEKHPVDGRIPLEIDHIDGDASNSAPGNLRVLCPNCHSLTPHHKGRNRGNSSREYFYKKVPI